MTSLGLAVGFAAISAGALALAIAERNGSRRRKPAGDAPALALKDGRGRRGGSLVGRTVTIAMPRQEVYAAWRDFELFPLFMENVRSVDTLDSTRSRWTIAAPGETEVTFETQIVEDRPAELIAWRSVPDAPVRNSGEVRFTDAPGGRGTQVQLRIVYDPPFGTLGKMTAKLLQREPGIQSRRELKRFKQWLETGEIATSVNSGAAPAALAG